MHLAELLVETLSCDEISHVLSTCKMTIRSCLSLWSPFSVKYWAWQQWKVPSATHLCGYQRGWRCSASSRCEPMNPHGPSTSLHLQVDLHTHHDHPRWRAVKASSPTWKDSLPKNGTKHLPRSPLAGWSEEFTIIHSNRGTKWCLKNYVYTSRPYIIKWWVTISEHAFQNSLGK